MSKHILSIIIFMIISISILICDFHLCHAESSANYQNNDIGDYKFANANVLDVSSGPIHRMTDDKTIHYRLVVILVEVNMVVYYQQIQYGDENCCLKINFTKEILGEDLEGDLKLFSVKNITWLSFDTVQFLGDSTRYTVKLSETGYKVKKQK